MALYLQEALSQLAEDVEMVDLRKVDLPFCDGDASYNHPNVGSLRDMIEGADSVAIAVPIYNYDAGATARNLIALTDKVWTEKVVGFVGAAGGERAYMSLMGLANSLTLDFRSIVVPRYVYASRAVFDGQSIASSSVRDRLDDLARDLDRFANAFRAHPS